MAIWLGWGKPVTCCRWGCLAEDRLGWQDTKGRPRNSSGVGVKGRGLQVSPGSVNGLGFVV